MKGSKLLWLWILLAVLGLTIGILGMTGCGGSKSSSGGGGGSDDDTADDDSADDDSDDDDSDDDSAYPNLNCPLPNPESLPAGQTIGGGSVADAGQITAYVYNDANCEPVEGAFVVYKGTAYPTSKAGDGKVVIPATSADTTTANADGFWAVSYNADAAIQYFRIRPTDYTLYGRSYDDSSTGDFTAGGAPLGLTNPTVDGILQIGKLLNNPLYLGVAIPGVSMNTILSADFLKGFLAQTKFDVTISGMNPFSLPSNIMLPTLTINNILGYTITGGNESYQVPVWAGAPNGTNPIEGLILKIYMHDVLTVQVLTNIITQCLPQ